ncbi:hypothetical protein SLEP1_g23012 [Rubroshorea leprosula]|uniref:Uncharacterized protein n=1 Tax=Rubroshorea leprosula TaxID=152421 RepID=A0AAV5JH55_9ROSI|nr:hypothetical protein SLEP1_g23012 [Rubroshorea leprosula]
MAAIVEKAAAILPPQHYAARLLAMAAIMATTAVIDNTEPNERKIKSNSSVVV